MFACTATTSSRCPLVLFDPEMNDQVNRQLKCRSYMLNGTVLGHDSHYYKKIILSVVTNMTN